MAKVPDSPAGLVTDKKLSVENQKVTYYNVPDYYDVIDLYPDFVKLGELKDIRYRELKATWNSGSAGEDVLDALLLLESMREPDPELLDGWRTVELPPEAHWLRADLEVADFLLWALGFAKRYHSLQGVERSVTSYVFGTWERLHGLGRWFEGGE